MNEPLKQPVAGELAVLLSEGLDLCVRARKMDETISNFVKERDTGIYESPLRCGTVPLWLQEQYDKDLADWEARARKALMEA